MLNGVIDRRDIHMLPILQVATISARQATADSPDYFCRAAAAGALTDYPRLDFLVTRRLTTAISIPFQLNSTQRTLLHA